MKEEERVLWVGPVTAVARLATHGAFSRRGETIVVTSAAEAKCVIGAFDRGMFAFDLPDGSGIVLAAEMMLEKRVRDVEFFHPNEDPIAREEATE